jgi:hypothetical protein
VTLVLAATSTDSIWLAADRRLSGEGRAPKDDGRKIMLLETDDGKAILGYAGLGATALGTEPADWMSTVLRGRRLPLELSLSVLAEAIKKRLPPHLVRFPRNKVAAHSVIVPALVKNEPRFYSIDLAFSPDRKNYGFRYTKWQTPPSLRGKLLPEKARTPRFAIAGSGAIYLMRRTKWVRDLLRILKAYDREKVSANAVADHFAALNHEVCRNLGSGTVGPRCIVAWRNGESGPRRGGGGQSYYTGTTRDANSPSLPTIANGMDIRAVCGVVMPLFMRNFEAMRAGQPSSELDKDQLNAELARLPHKPDETLR